MLEEKQKILLNDFIGRENKLLEQLTKCENNYEDSKRQNARLKLEKDAMEKELQDLFGPESSFDLS